MAGKKGIKMSAETARTIPAAAAPYAQYVPNCHICTETRLNEHIAVAASLVSFLHSGPT